MTCSVVCIGNFEQLSLFKKWKDKSMCNVYQNNFSDLLKCPDLFKDNFLCIFSAFSVFIIKLCQNLAQNEKNENK